MGSDEFEISDESFGNREPGNRRESDQYKEQSPMIKITGVSKRKNRLGQTFLIGSLNALTQVLILPNNTKDRESAPDYYLYIRVNSHSRNFDPSRKPAMDI